MTMPEALRDLQSGPDGRVAECLDTKAIIYPERAQTCTNALSSLSVASERWITRDR